MDYTKGCNLSSLRDFNLNENEAAYYEYSKIQNKTKNMIDRLTNIRHWMRQSRVENEFIHIYFA